jgi:uncharacterized coiled-coil DUF342 family protein
VSIFRRRGAAQREPHPDPLTERDLQRILSLREQAATRARLAEDYRREIMALHQASRLSSAKHRDSFYKRADILHDKIRQLEGDISQLYDEIARVMASMNPQDLAYL